MLKRILIALLIVIAGILLFAATKPDTLRVERSATINAPADRVYPLLADFHQWPLWSPWEDLDPAMTRTHRGAPSGRGAIYEWAGNSDVGRGRMEITDTVEPTGITIALDFIEPWEGHNITQFALTPQGDTTAIRWTMEGPSPYMMKVMSVFMSMDRMIGNDFEKGLARLKAVAEKPVAGLTQDE